MDAVCCPKCGTEIEPPRQETMQFRDLVFNTGTSIAFRSGKQIRLTRREADLLEYRMRRPGRIRTRTDICNQAGKVGFRGLTNCVDVYVNYLRNKIDSGFETKLIHTKRGIGYVFGLQEDLQ